MSGIFAPSLCTLVITLASLRILLRINRVVTVAVLILLGCQRLQDRDSLVSRQISNGELDARRSIEIHIFTTAYMIRCVVLHLPHPIGKMGDQNAWPEVFGLYEEETGTQGRCDTVSRGRPASPGLVASCKKTDPWYDTTHYGLHKALHSLMMTPSHVQKIM